MIGNRQSHYIVASVTDDEDGQPVTGLIPNNFKVVTMVSPNGGVPIQVTGITEGTLPGFYRINVVPPGNETWKSGDYIFSIAVVKRLKDRYWHICLYVKGVLLVAKEIVIVIAYTSYLRLILLFPKYLVCTSIVVSSPSISSKCLNGYDYSTA